MAKSVDYGIESVVMTPAMPDGSYPDFLTATKKVSVQLILMDSFQRDKEDDKTTDIEVEDLDDVFLTLKGQKGKRTISFGSYDLSSEQFKYFLGYKEGTGGEMVEEPGFELPPQAMQLTTKAIDKYPAKVHTWAKLDVKVKETGTVGKNGLPNLQFNITVPANLSPTGQQLPNHKWALKA